VHRGDPGSPTIVFAVPARVGGRRKGRTRMGLAAIVSRDSREGAGSPDNHRGRVSKLPATSTGQDPRITPGRDQDCRIRGAQGGQRAREPDSTRPRSAGTTPRRRKECHHAQKTVAIPGQDALSVLSSHADGHRGSDGALRTRRASVTSDHDTPESARSGAGACPSDHAGK